MAQGQGGGIDNPSPFQKFANHISLINKHLLLSNNYYYRGESSIGTDVNILGISAGDQVILGTSSLLDLYLYTKSTENVYFQTEAGTRGVFDNNFNFRITTAIATGLAKGMAMPKGTNPTANPADGFTINAEASDGRPWVRDENGNKGILPYFKTGTYTGDGTTSQAITGVGFQPKVVMILGENVDAVNWITTDQHTATYANAINGTNWDNDQIIAIGADGFTVDDDGSDADPNTNGRTYIYICWG